jgi:D-galactose 1-dehydrogenase
VIKLAIVGLGHAAGHQLAALERVAGFEIAAVCDTDPATRSAAPSGVPFFSSSGELCANAHLDAAVVAVPPSEHYEIARRLLYAGVDVLLEKPATQSLGEFDELAAIARERGRTLVVAFHAAFGLDVQWFADRYAADLRHSLGPLTGFHCAFYDPYVANGVVAARARALGGSWFDSGINALSVVERFVPAERIELDSAAITRVPQIDVGELHGSVLLRFPVAHEDSAGRGAIETNWTLGLDSKVTRLYFGDARAEIVLHHSDQRVLAVNGTGAATVLADLSPAGPRLVNHYVGVFEDFAARLRSRDDNLEAARELHGLLLDAYAPR